MAIEEVDGVYRCLTVPEAFEGFRIDVFLTQLFDGYSRKQIKDAVQSGGAEVNGKVIRPSLKLHAGQTIRFRVRLVQRRQ